MRFNPHTHAGCDSLVCRLFPLLIYSFNPHTHAGCDCVMLISKCMLCSFNPHTHAGCDAQQAQVQRDWQVSIHTPTQGVTQMAAQFGIKAPVSIHTPTQGVTVRLSCCSFIGLVSIHTPTQGVTLCSGSVLGNQWFQSTHPRRV